MQLQNIFTDRIYGNPTHVCALDDRQIVVGFGNNAYVQRFVRSLDWFSPHGDAIEVENVAIDSIVSVSKTNFAVMHVNGAVWVISQTKQSLLQEDTDTGPFYINAYNDGYYLRLSNSEMCMFSSSDVRFTIKLSGTPYNIKGCITVFNVFVDHVFLFYDQKENNVNVATVDYNNNIVLKCDPLALAVLAPSEYMCSTHLFNQIYAFVFCNVLYLVKCEFNGGQYDMSIVYCYNFNARVDVMQVCGLSHEYIIMSCQERDESKEKFWAVLRYNASTGSLTSMPQPVYDSICICTRKDDMYALIKENGQNFMAFFLMEGDYAKSQTITPQKRHTTLTDVNVLMV